MNLRNINSKVDRAKNQGRYLWRLRRSIGLACVGALATFPALAAILAVLFNNADCGHVNPCAPKQFLYALNPSIFLGPVCVLITGLTVL